MSPAHKQERITLFILPDLANANLRGARPFLFALPSESLRRLRSFPTRARRLLRRERLRRLQCQRQRLPLRSFFHHARHFRLRVHFLRRPRFLAKPFALARSTPQCPDSDNPATRPAPPQSPRPESRIEGQNLPAR